MNIEDKSALRECTSCQLCAAVCPKGAISISLDADGFYRPFINYEKCVDCGFCTKFCYKFDNQILDFGQDKLNDTILYGASAKNTDIVDRTTSGGIAELLVNELIEEGYKCVGVVYDSLQDCAIDKIAATKEETFTFRGSKYIQSYTVDAFKKVISNCKNEKFAVFGTPCHIYALDKYLSQRKVREDFILIDLYCHGCPSMNIWKKYIKNIKKKFCQTRIDNANFRSKIKGWGDFYVALEVDGKPFFYSDKKHNEFFDLFFSDLVLNPACNDCKLKSTLDYTDIRLGDFWGKQYVLNSKGVSGVSVVTDNGKSLFDKIKDKVIYRQEKYENFLPWQCWGKENHPDQLLRDKLFEQLRDETIALSKSIDTIYQHQNLKSKVIRWSKNLIHMMPLSWEKRVRWIFYRL